MNSENTLEKGALYIVGTPIGNLGDFSPRGVETLSQADFIAAEDTRVTMKLLNRFEIKKPLISYFEHNKADRGEVIINRLKAGETCALVSDAGMPAISDPGEALVAACAAENIPVYVVPGPTAVISALAISGLPTGRFAFEGFLSVNKRTRREHLQSVANEQRTMVFYEAPHKLAKTLADLAEVMGGDRKIAIVRELTKIHETVWRTTLGEAIEFYKTNDPKGEFVLVVEGAQPTADPADEYTPEAAADLARERMAQGLSASDAAKEIAKLTGIKKGDIYKLL